MIYTFDEKKKAVLFPVKWANEVVAWISGIHSKSGTIKITNTLNPQDGGGMSLDIDTAVLARKVEKSLYKRAVEKYS